MALFGGKIEGGQSGFRFHTITDAQLNAYLFSHEFDIMERAREEVRQALAASGRTECPEEELLALVGRQQEVIIEHTKYFVGLHNQAERGPQGSIFAGYPYTETPESRAGIIKWSNRGLPGNGLQSVEAGH